MGFYIVITFGLNFLCMVQCKFILSAIKCNGENCCNQLKCCKNFALKQNPKNRWSGVGLQFYAIMSLHISSFLSNNYCRADSLVKLPWQAFIIALHNDEQKFTN